MDLQESEGLKEKLSQVKHPKKCCSELFQVSDTHTAVKAWGNLCLFLGIRTQKVLHMRGNIRYHVENSEVYS